MRYEYEISPLRWHLVVQQTGYPEDTFSKILRNLGPYLQGHKHHIPDYSHLTYSKMADVLQLLH